LQYDESANNQVVKVKLDETFDVVLPETRTAGYRWTLKANPESVCTLLEDAAQAKPAGVGGSGKRTWRFRAATPGECEIELRYARPWESSSGPAKTFRLKVQVQS
jgi:predicted secreted protein